MTLRTNFPRSVREIENLWIPMPDGARLAARVWLPENAESAPIPALFEFIPYRKSDGTTLRDSLRQPYFAGHGYAVLRVDLRGSGDSDGVLSDEYTVQELDDAVAAIAWIARQPWCDGNVGMMGISWGGFNSLQVAARRPPALKAVLVIGFTDDRYADDVHYMGGCVITSQMLSWASVMLAYNALPPDPRWAGKRWRDMWTERLEGSPPFVEAWLEHQTRDDYWKHGSVGEDYDAIRVPVYAVGGWADSYNNSVPRLLAALSVPRKGLIGPWAHTFPEMGGPEPTIGFLQDSLRWWDHWLKGIDTGIMDEPMLCCWIQESVPPATFYAERPGRWVADPSWPSPHVSEQVRYLASNGAASWLDETPGAEVTLGIRGREGHGFDVGQWGSYGSPGEWPGDQRPADGESLTFDGRPLDQPLDILGYPMVDLLLSVDRPLALVAVRLCDVAPDGASTLVSWGLLNLTHRDSHEFPELLVPGRRYRVTVQLNVISYRLPAGHRWRLAVSPTYTRHAWPSPEPVTLTVYTGAQSGLRLPVRAPHPGDAALSPFLPAETAAPLAMEILRTPATRKTIHHDLIDGITEYRIEDDTGRNRHVGSGMEVDDRLVERYTVRDGEPLSLKVRIERTLEMQREAWRVRIETDSMMTADATHFYLSNHLDAYEGDARVFTKSWTKAIPRRLV
ncbi:MAG: CocE/NonD family hydrolase [Candidatus Promineofilum sp.]|uniref:CocE/NonD family hydrolase n=1 Tax=Promineifilum sp. TaxID=2664178 RepID=UPI002411B361|nr:CocE/NonD family hydrolase [Promineifilum sp.]